MEISSSQNRRGQSRLADFEKSAHAPVLRNAARLLEDARILRKIAKISIWTRRPATKLLPPPNLPVIKEGPINAFFVRYLADLPLNADPDKFTLEDQEAEAGRDRRGEPMLREQPRIFRSAHWRWPVGKRCNGVCTLARRSTEGGA